MNLIITDSDWTLVPIPGDKQITNVGNCEIRISQQTDKPTNAQDGLVLSTYKHDYATIISKGMANVWLLPVGGQGVAHIESVEI